MMTRADMLRARRDLHLWARDKPSRVQSLVHVLRAQLRTLAQCPHSRALRSIVAQSVERLHQA